MKTKQCLKTIRVMSDIKKEYAKASGSLKTNKCMPVLAVHKTFEKGESQKRQTNLYVSDGGPAELITDATLEDWMGLLPAKTTLRFTGVHAQDPLINDLVGRGYKVVYANWHKTGLEKNLPPQDIAQQFALLPESTFREFTPRPELSELRYRVSQRLAILEYRKSVVLKLKGAARLFGQVNEEDESNEIKLLLESANQIETRVPITKNGKEKMVSIDTLIANMAQEIRECKLFNAAAHITGAWNTAAAVVSFSGGIDRFDEVASFWHYCGEHVVDGHAPKRMKGHPVDWSPRLRTLLWQMSDSIIKNRENPWRDYYEQELEKELAQHGEKHPGCKTPQGHCGARAKRKMRKEILKRFFLACKGEEFNDGHFSGENQAARAVI